MKTEIIQAIMDKKTVQFKYWHDQNTWNDFIIANSDLYTTELFANLFNNSKIPYEWRIKPEFKEVICKSALMNSGYSLYVLTINSAEEAIELETNSTFFVKWLTDWITYKVGV